MRVLSETCKPMLLLLAVVFGIAVFSPSISFAEEAAGAAEATTAVVDEINPTYVLNNFVLFVCAVLVLFMQAGFSLVEAGMNSAKNVVNILFKNLMDLSIGLLLFFLVGFAIMYPGSYQSEGAEALNGYFAFGGFGIYPENLSGEGLSNWADWFFQAVFAATAATIVSGAVAGRMKFGSYLIFSAVLTALVYPISGYWKWGEGWLYQMGFQDFAGSVVVHAVGGFAGLAGAMLLGPRIGRFNADGKPQAMPGHNMALVALGVFVLWVGWYGFNPGSNLAFTTASEINATIKIAVTTSLAAAAGTVVAALISWIWLKKPDLSFSLNGALGGLVGITAGCDCFEPMMAILVGAIAGCLVVGGVVLLEKLQIDDPVGAWPVHGLCGVWGCMAIGFIPNSHLAAGTTTFLVQLTGTAVIVAWAFLTMLALFGALKVFGILRVSREEEMIGLDVSEHGMSAYPNDLFGVTNLHAPSPAKVGATAPAVVAGAKSAIDN